jgi:hypothetical protein
MSVDRDGLDYYEDLKFNPENLGEEWQKQPVLYSRYADLAADAELAYNKAVEHKKTVRSQIWMDAAQGGEDILGKGMKPTEKNVEAYMRQSPKYRKAKEAELEAKHVMDVLKNAVFAFHQRKVALESTVQLVVSKIYASPSEPKELRQLADSILQAASVNKIRKSMRKAEVDDDDDEDSKPEPKAVIGKKRPMGSKRTK